MKARQIPLDLAYQPGLAEKDFVRGQANRDALAWIDRWPDWPGKFFALFGPEGSGKTHLSRIWAARAEAVILNALPEEGKTSAALVLESPKKWPERALLHLLNAQRESGGFTLVVDRDPPARWPIELPDLRSRLSAMPAIALQAPDDDLLCSVLAKHFFDRNHDVAPELLLYMARRIDRSFAAAAAAVQLVDRQSLAERRPVSQSLIRDALQGADGPDQRS